MTPRRKPGGPQGEACAALFRGLVNRRTCLAALALSAVAVVPRPAAGQAPSPAVRPAATPKPAAAKTWTPRRTPDGQPDIQGTWSYATLTPLERPAELAGKETFTAQEAAEFHRRTVARINTDRRDGGGDADVGRSYNEFWRDRGAVGAGRTSLIVDPPDGRLPPMTAEGRRLEDARNRARSGPPSGPEDRNLWERCLTRGLPMLPASYNNLFQVVQTPGTVLMVLEMVHDARVIPLDHRPHLASGIRSWRGDARGRWEGDTLVVDTTNFNDVVSVRGSSSSLHLVERFTRTGPETLLYQFTIDDPQAYTRPWTAVIPAVRTTERIYEYACHEGNYALADILAGARAEERKGGPR
jgi:hypothetical protein